MFHAGALGVRYLEVEAAYAFEWSVPAANDTVFLTLFYADVADVAFRGLSSTVCTEILSPALNTLQSLTSLNDSTAYWAIVGSHVMGNYVIPGSHELESGLAVGADVFIR